MDGLSNVENDELVDVFPSYIEQGEGPACLLMDAERLVALLVGGMDERDAPVDHEAQAEAVAG